MICVPELAGTHTPGGGEGVEESLRLFDRFFTCEVKVNGQHFKALKSRRWLYVHGRILLYLFGTAPTIFRDATIGICVGLFCSTSRSSVGKSLLYTVYYRDVSLRMTFYSLSWCTY